MIAEQRRQGLQAALNQRLDWSGTEVGMAQYHLEHHQACQQSQALFAQENSLFMTFIADIYQVRLQKSPHSQTHHPHLFSSMSFGVVMVQKSNAEFGCNRECILKVRPPAVLVTIMNWTL